MKPEDLLGDDAFKPEKLFNEKTYRTIVVKRDGFSKKENAAADLLATLIEGGLSREEVEEIFSDLKESASPGVLVDAIKACTDDRDLAVLVAACWECGLDFSAYFPVFAQLACHPSYSVAMEALTVTEQCDGQIPREALIEARSIAMMSNDAQEAIREELLHQIEERLESADKK